MNTTTAIASSSEPTQTENVTSVTFPPLGTQNETDLGSHDEYRSLIAACSMLALLNVVVGTPANTLICAAVVLNKTLRTGMNVLIINLSIADFIICCVCSTLMAVASLGYVTDAFGSVPDSLCHTLDSFHVLGGSVQLITLASISFERYQALNRPFDKQYRLVRIRLSVIASWVAGVVCMIMAWTSFPESPTHLLCIDSDIEYAHKNLSYELGMYIFVPLTLLSVCVILVFYGNILYLVQKHVKSTEKTLGASKRKQNKIAPLNNISQRIIVNASFPAAITENNAKIESLKCNSLAESSSNNSSGTKQLPVRRSEALAIANDRSFDLWPKTEPGAQLLPARFTESESLVPHPSAKNTHNSASLEEAPLDFASEMTSTSQMKSNVLRGTSSSSKETGYHGSFPDLQKESLNEETWSNYAPRHDGFSEISGYMEVGRLGPEMERRSAGNCHQLTGGGSSLGDDCADVGCCEATNKQQNPQAPKFPQFNKIVTFAASNSHVTDWPEVNDIHEEFQQKKGQIPNDFVTNSPDVFGIHTSSATCDQFASTCVCHHRSKATTPCNNSGLRTEAAVPPIKTNGDVSTSEITRSKRTKAMPSSANTPRFTSNIPSSLPFDDSKRIERKKSAAKSNENPSTSRAERRRSRTKGNKSTSAVVEIHDADGKMVKATTTKLNIAGDVCVMSSSNKIKGKRKIEAKSAKRTAVVLVTFLIAWLPFPIVLVILWVLNFRTRTADQVEALLSSYLTSFTLSLLAASINPLVYGAINKPFSKEFMKLVSACRKRCRTR